MQLFLLAKSQSTSGGRTKTTVLYTGNNNVVPIQISYNGEFGHTEVNKRVNIESKAKPLLFIGQESQKCTKHLQFTDPLISF